MKVHPPSWYCGGHARTTGRPCRNRAGFRTDHFGYGKCYLHGGLTPIKHGLYSNWFPEMLADSIEAGKDLSALEHAQEALVAQSGLVIHYARRFEGVKPTREDIEHLEKWLARVVKTAESISKIRYQQALTVGEAVAVFEGWARIVERYIDDPDRREALGKDLGAYLERLHGALGEDRSRIALPSRAATTADYSR